MEQSEISQKAFDKMANRAGHLTAQVAILESQLEYMEGLVKDLQDKLDEKENGQ